MGIINRTSKHSHVQKKKSRVKICKTLALPTSLYRNETWAMNFEVRHPRCVCSIQRNLSVISKQSNTTIYLIY